jgi:hypothetical protein
VNTPGARSKRQGLQRLLQHAARRPHGLLNEQQIKHVMACCWTRSRRSTSNPAPSPACAGLFLALHQPLLIMNLSKREFLQVLGAGTVAGMAWAAMPTPMRPRRRTRPVRPAALRQCVVPAHDRLPCAAQAHLLPRAQRQPGPGRHEGPGPHLVGENLLKQPASAPARRWPTPTPTWTLKRPPAATARWAALRTWPRWSSA